MTGKIILGIHSFFQGVLECDRSTATFFIWSHECYSKRSFPFSDNNDCMETKSTQRKEAIKSSCSQSKPSQEREKEGNKLFVCAVTKSLEDSLHTRIECFSSLRISGERDARVMMTSSYSFLLCFLASYCHLLRNFFITFPFLVGEED